jgi:hypothetical protein
VLLTQVQVASLWSAAARSRVAVDDFPRALLVRYSQVAPVRLAASMCLASLHCLVAAVPDCCRDRTVPYLPVQPVSRLPARGQEVARSPVAVGDCSRDLLVHYSLVALSPPLQAPAPDPAVARSLVVVRDCRRVHPVHCSPDERRAQSSRPELAYPGALA